MTAVPDKDGRLLVGYFDYLNKKENVMTQENLPEDNQGNVDPAEAKRVVTETVEPVEPAAVKVTETVVEPVAPHSNS